MMTLDAGRIMTCRRPAFSALVMDLRASARTEVRVIVRCRWREGGTVVSMRKPREYPEGFQVACCMKQRHTRSIAECVGMPIKESGITSVFHRQIQHITTIF